MIIHLYIKVNTKTGLLYFGKTQKQDPYGYIGSGIYWLRHNKIHGKEFIKTLKIWTFTNQTECTNFSLKFSKDNNIVESIRWANLKEENGLDGNPRGTKHTQESKQKISETHWCRGKFGADNIHTGLKRSEETKKNISKAKLGIPNLKLKGIIVSDKTKKLQSNKRKGNHINLTLEQQKSLINFRFDVLELFKSNPILNMSYNYIAKNGKYFSYENAFAKTYAARFNVNSRTILNILRGEIIPL